MSAFFRIIRIVHLHQISLPFHFKENKEARRGQAPPKPGLKETTVEELVEAREAPKNKHLRVGGSQFRKRKSMNAIKLDAVSSKVKMFSQVVNKSTSTPAPSSATQSKLKSSIK